MPPGQVLARKLAGAWVDIVRPLTRVLIKNKLLAAGKVIALAPAQMLLLGVISGYTEIAAVKSRAPGAGHAPLLTATVTRYRRKGIKGRTVFFLGNDVDHAGNCVGAVNGRCTVFQYFDPINRCQRQYVHIERRGTALDSGRSCTTAIE